MYQQLYSDIRQIKHTFARTVTSVRQYIIKCGCDYKDLMIYALNMGILSEEDEKRIREASNADDVITVLTTYWSFLDTEPLDNIIVLFGSEENKVRMDKYNHELRSFCQRRVSRAEFPDSYGIGENSGRKKLRIALDLNDPTVRRVRNLEVVIANILGRQASEVALHDIGSGGNPGNVMIVLLVI